MHTHGITFMQDNRAPLCGFTHPAPVEAAHQLRRRPGCNGIRLRKKAERTGALTLRYTSPKVRNARAGYE